MISNKLARQRYRRVTKRSRDFIQNPDTRVRGQQARQRQAPPLTGRKHPRGNLLTFGKAYAVEERLRLMFSQSLAVQGAGDAQVLDRAQLVLDSILVSEIRNLA